MSAASQTLKLHHNTPICRLMQNCYIMRRICGRWSNLAILITRAPCCINTLMLTYLPPSSARLKCQSLDWEKTLISEQNILLICCIILLFCCQLAPRLPNTDSPRDSEAPAPRWQQHITRCDEAKPLWQASECKREIIQTSGRERPSETERQCAILCWQHKENISLNKLLVIMGCDEEQQHTDLVSFTAKQCDEAF